MEKQAREWAANCDPFELVTAVRQGTHELDQGGSLEKLSSDKKDRIVAATEEIATRFEHASRSALGSKVPAGGYGSG